MTGELQRLVEMGERLERVNDRIAELEAQLKEAQAAQRRLALEDIPQLAEEVGFQDAKITLRDGRTLTIARDVKASIPERNRAEAMDWLRAHGFAGLIKTEVVARFERGDNERARQVVDRIAAEHDEVELKEIVHPSTLEAFVRERMTAGEDFPWELFGAHPFAKAEVK